MRPNDNTNYQQNVENSVNPENNNGKKAAILAGAGVAAAAVAGGAAYYATRDNGEEVAENLEEQAAGQTTEQTVGQTAEQTTASTSSTTEHHHHSNSHHHHTNSHQKQVVNPKPDPEDEKNSFVKENDVKITNIESKIDEDGNVHHVAYGTVNGHQAVFFDNGDGKIVASIIDENNDGEVQETEIHEFKSDELELSKLAENMAGQNDSDIILANNGGEINDEPKVTVVAVENDVEINGQTVDMAEVEINETPVLFIDSEQDGEVNVAVIDANTNNQIDEGEVMDVSDQHIPMPTEDDIDDGCIAANDDLPDYSNDADTTTYEV